jgi:hypothetical protein
VNTHYFIRCAHRLFRCKSIVLGAAAAIALVGVSTAQPCRAANVVLTDGNSSVTIDPTATAGVENWTVAGQNQLNQEWFWFRSGSKGGQSSLNSLGTPSVTLLDTNNNGLNDVAKLIYGSSSGLQITVTYMLSGGQAGSLSSDLSDTIKISNNGSSALDFHFFEYANFNLGNSTSGESVAIVNGNTSTVSGNGGQAQTVVSPIPNEFEANVSPTLLNEISSSSKKYTLSDANSASSGDGEFGDEWDASLAMCGSSLVITGDTVIKAPAAVVQVPEPVNGAMAVLGLSGTLLMRRRNRTAKAHSAA